MIKEQAADFHTLMKTVAGDKKYVAILVSLDDANPEKATLESVYAITDDLKTDNQIRPILLGFACKSLNNLIQGMMRGLSETERNKFIKAVNAGKAFDGLEIQWKPV